MFISLADFFDYHTKLLECKGRCATSLSNVNALRKNRKGCVCGAGRGKRKGKMSRCTQNFCMCIERRRLSETEKCVAKYPARHKGGGELQASVLESGGGVEDR